ncbi:ABC-type uncharacterized transport system ATPase subunit [Bradyrhizobium sp. S3.14.4]
MLDQTSNDLHSGEPPLLQTIGLTKRYGDFLANDSISIEIQPKQIHALLGENGAGKSTLVKAIYGLIQPSAGEIRWQGHPIVLSGPSEARSRGIGMVFQHFSLFDNLTVAENVALGLDGRESFKDMSARLEQVSKTYGLPLDPRREVWQLSVGERQRIEIVRALMQDPKFLILDEPTAVLTPQEADQLFIVLERLKAEGRAILYISHKLEEVKRLCDTATILRGGKKVETCNPRLETAASLARMMVGGEIREVRAPVGRKTTVPRLVVNDLSLAPSEAHGVRLEHISFELKGGEILGIAGVAGNGQDELFAALSGERLSKDPGTVVIEGIAAWPPLDHPAPQAGRGVRPGGTARPRHRAAHEAVGERATDRARRQRHGPSRLHRHRGDTENRGPRDRNVRRSQGQTGSGSCEPVRRQFAKVHRRPRDPAQPRGAGGEPADLGRRCRCRRRDPPGAA